MADMGRAVVVASHRTVRAVIELACRALDVIVVGTADTAAEATAACRSSRPRTSLVLDLDSPMPDGFRVLTDLDDDRPGAVLVLADRADGDMVLRALRLGARGYVTKADGLGTSPRPSVVFSPGNVSCPRGWSTT